MQSFAQGASFGFVDEMSAMVDAAYMSLPDGDQDFWKNYDESWSIRNQQNDAYSAANPATAMTMEIVGAIMSGGASIAAGRGAAKVGVGRLTSKQAAALNAAKGNLKQWKENMKGGRFNNGESDDGNPGKGNQGKPDKGKPDKENKGQSKKD